MNHIFAAQTRQGTLKIYEVARGNVEKLPALKSVFDELFPQYHHYHPRLEAIARGDIGEMKHKVPHQWLVEIDDEPAGLINFTYLEKANVGVGHNLAILPRFRRFSFGSFSRMSEFLVYLALQQLLSDGSGKAETDPAGMLVEVEMAATSSDPNVQTRREHLFRRYEEYGILELPVCYYEPPGLIRNGDKQEAVNWERLDFRPMRLGIFPHLPKQQILQPDSLSKLLTAFLCHHYGLERDHWAVQEGMASIVSEDIEEIPTDSPLVEEAVLA